MTSAPAAGSVALLGVTKHYGSQRGVDDLSFTASGEFLTLVGPSGSGKSTTLRLIGGFLQPSAGRIELGGRDMTATPAHRRPVHTVFQNFALFPHLTVEQNVAFPLRMAGLDRREQAKRVTEALDLVRLPGVGARRPDQLSGGQQQRVALARALVNRPPVLLLDEPLGALDPELRQEMQGELKRLQREVGATFVAVTHDQAEAMATADRIAVLRDGRLIEIGSPRQLYECPRTPFVARFVSRANILPGELLTGSGGEGIARAPAGVIVHGRFAAEPAPTPGTPVVIVARPERMRVRGSATTPADTPGAMPKNALPVTITDVGFAGGYWRVAARLASGEEIVAHERPEWEDSVALRRGDAAWLRVAPADTLLLVDDREPGGGRGGGNGAEPTDH